MFECPVCYEPTGNCQCDPATLHEFYQLRFGPKEPELPDPHNAVEVGIYGRDEFDCFPLGGYQS